jgi:hypothetical protein
LLAEVLKLNPNFPGFCVFEQLDKSRRLLRRSTESMMEGRVDEIAIDKFELPSQERDRDFGLLLLIGVESRGETEKGCV